MEHSLLHAIGLWGLIMSAGGPLLVLGLLKPALQFEGPQYQETNRFSTAVQGSVARWMICGAAVTAFAAVLDVFVQVAEVRGSTVFGGVALSDVGRFAIQTTVGELALARAGVLLAIAAIAWIWRGRWHWWLTGSLAVAAIVLTALVSHAAAQPTGRRAAVFVQVMHLGGVVIWLGVLFHLLALRERILRATGKGDIVPLAEMVRRFSPVALGAVSLLLVSGTIAAFRFLASTGALFTSAYGLTLLLKLAVLTPALFAGLVNQRVVRPRLLSLRDSIRPSNDPILRRFGQMLELEVTAGLLVLALAGILASVSPPGNNPSLRLTKQQVRTLVSPQVPTMSIPNPIAFYGAPKRTLDDLRYSEFTHHSSGVIVCLLGLCWLAQGAGGKIGFWCGRIWPWLLVPFAVFVAIASDPELWWLHRVSPSRAFADPQLLEHQLGACMILLLAWLGWRDDRRADSLRPLGYALPVIMILGSLLLLGHAHSTFTSDDELTNLINVQHAIFGSFGLFAGTVRWFELRGLFPQRVARWIWPALIIGLGLFMTFFYREVV